SARSPATPAHADARVPPDPSPTCWSSTDLQSAEYFMNPNGRGRVVRHRLRNDRLREVKNGAKVKPYRNPHGAWYKATADARLDDLNLHDLRHTFASRLVMRGVPLLTVSKLLGHATIQMTMRYAHLAPDAFDVAISALDSQRNEAA
ncbi:site-specific integrase, partial [Azospirillum isscasi]